MVSTSPLISKFSNPCTNPLGTGPSYRLQLVSPSLSCSTVFKVLLQGPGTYLSFHFLLVLLSGQREQQSSLFSRLFFLLTVAKSGRLAEIRWSVCISLKEFLCVSFSRVDSGLCINHVFLWSNSNFLHPSQWITFPTQSCLVLCINHVFLWSNSNFLHPSQWITFPTRSCLVLCIKHVFLWSNSNFLHPSQWITFPTLSCQVLCINHVFLWSNSNFLHPSQWITFPTLSCLVL